MDTKIRRSIIDLITRGDKINFYNGKVRVDTASAIATKRSKSRFADGCIKERERE